MLRLCWSFLLLLLTAILVQAVTLEQVISRENPLFKCAQANLAVGRDGRVYVANGGNGTGYLLRLDRDGSHKVGGAIHYATQNVAANGDGIIAGAAGHFMHSVLLYDTSITQVASCGDFLVNDTVGWDGPGHVEVGASGDFYGLDQNRDRIVRLNALGKIVTTYPVARDGNKVYDFRVCEKTQCFLIWTWGRPLRMLGFDGTARPVPALGDNGGAVDFDDEGNLYAIERRSNTVKKFSPAMAVVGTVALEMNGLQPAPAESGFTALRVWGNEVFLKRAHPTELFQRYDLTSGARTTVASIDYERLGVTFPDGALTAGETVPFTIDFYAGGRKITPRWRVWASPIGVPDHYTEVTWADGKVQVPAAFAGLYQFKVTPEAQPVQYGTASEYLVRTAVEVRQPGTRGSASLLTPDNRVYYGRGEAIPVTVVVRAADADLPAAVTVRLQQGTKTLAELNVPMGTQDPADADRFARRMPFTISKALTAGLLPGNYQLTATAPGLTGVAQPLIIGPGVRPTDSFFVRFGDYGTTYPEMNVAGGLWETPDQVAAHLKTTRTLGINLLADRIGSHLQITNLQWDHRVRGEAEQIAKRLRDDPAAIAPEKVVTAAPLLQTMAGYSAQGVQQMAIPLYMDAGLPLGTGFDTRKPEQMVEAVKTVTSSLVQYPSFRGWVWSANWWHYGGGGAKDAATPEEQAAYLAALKQAKETGKWDPVLDKVSGIRFGRAVEAQELFTSALRNLQKTKNIKTDHLVTANSGPYRKVETYPPVAFSNVDEVDLHIQWEQIAVPYVSPHNADFYKRPGKRAWGHPEVWNDAGTGDQVLPTLFQMLMRGADGIGFSGLEHPWGIKPEDPRLSDHGYLSIWRALNSVLTPYGPWITTLQKSDKVAIIADGRQFRIDEWKHVTGLHFVRLLEAYTTCLHAHTPASFVFTDDLQPNLLNQYKAILLVDQWVEMEPELRECLQLAKAKGVQIFYDDTCRKELMTGFTPLGVAFNKFENDPSQAGDDAAYWRFLGYVRANLPAVAKALQPVAPPPAGVENEEVFLTERTAGDGRYLFVVNNTTPMLDPGQLWRVTLVMTSRVPVVAPVTLPADAKVVYDVFAMKPVTPQGGTVQADLRTLPMRVYALLPAPIGQVVLNGPKTVKAGQPFTWTVQVLDAAGKAIRTTIPVRVRLVTNAGDVVEERYLSAGAAGASDTFTAPLDLQPGTLTLTATELFSGKQAGLAIAVTAGTPMKLDDATTPAAVPASVKATGTTAPPGAATPVEAHFGPHIRDMVVSADGRTVLMNTNNWDHNLYAVDVETSQVRWRQRAGHYFAFAPQALANGFAVQGFDFNSAEGYHLYLGGNDGTLERRFALYGLPQRLPHRFVPALIKDHINNFAVAADGSWVASAGDLGLAVWDRAGTRLWWQDWWPTKRHTATLCALGTNALLVAEGMTLTRYDATSGKATPWGTLAATGEVREIHATRDGQTVAVQTTSEGGRIYVLRDGAVVDTVITAAGTLDIAPDGSALAVTNGNQLKYYALTGEQHGLLWTYAGDEVMRFPRFAPDSARVTATTDLGSLYVLDRAGQVLHTRDLGGVAVPAWLPNGDLLAGTWMGTLVRLDGTYQERWRTRLQPEATDMRGTLAADDPTPTVKMDGWGNNTPEPLPLEPNLLAQVKTIIKFVPQAGWGGWAQLEQDPKLLYDGQPDAPPAPWLLWARVGFFAETSPFNYLLIDAFNTRMKVTGITLVEDAAHPESWLRDASFEYWDAAAEKWVPVQPLMANAAVHTHLFKQPVEAARFRIVMPWGLVGNLRLGEIVFHGEVLGASHPDAAAQRPVAVLFDEGDDELKCLQYGGNGCAYQFDGAFTGGRFLAMTKDGEAGPLWQPPFGHVVPNWDFEIAENPQPGQYRYLQFAWKALDPATKSMMLTLQGQGIYAGDNPGAGGQPKQVADTPPTAWTQVRVDLWELFKRPTHLQALSLRTRGGGMGVDRILLGRTEADLPPLK